jgi:hypothetical protein
MIFFFSPKTRAHDMFQVEPRHWHITTLSQDTMFIESASNSLAAFSLPLMHFQGPLLRSQSSTSSLLPQKRCRCILCDIR